MSWVRAALAAADPAADLLLGARCPGCGRPGWLVCAGCQGLLGAPVTRVWPRAGGLPPVFAAGEYAPPLAGLVVAVKERGMWLAAPTLAGALARAVAGAAAHARTPAVRLVPVPSADRAVRERGLDVVAEVARLAARELRGWGVDASAVPCLAQRRGVLDQAGLGAAERQRNMADALALRRRPPTGAVIVVDDVVTTGASLAAACGVLRSAGADVRAAAVVCARA